MAWPVQYRRTSERRRLTTTPVGLLLANRWWPMAPGRRGAALAG